MGEHMPQMQILESSLKNKKLYKKKKSLLYFKMGYNNKCKLLLFMSTVIDFY